MKKIHIALGVADLSASVLDYSKRLGKEPEIIVDGEYALWRTESINFSIRKSSENIGLRHLGFEDSLAPEFAEETDVNGIVWERFNASHQLDEIRTLWPDV